MPTEKSYGRLLWQLFLNFMNIGAFTFGGGYAMLPLIEHSCIEKHKWMTPDEMTDIIVIAESTPGPISVNCATFIGFRQAGIIGALAATCGLVLPSFVIIFTISMFLGGFLQIKEIAAAFQGIKIAVGILIFNAGLTMLIKSERNFLSLAIMGISCILMMGSNLWGWKISSVIMMIAAGLISYIIFTASRIAARPSKNKLPQEPMGVETAASPVTSSSDVSPNKNDGQGGSDK